MKSVFKILFILFIVVAGCKLENKESRKEENHKKEMAATRKDALIVEKIDSTAIPASIKYSGNIKSALSWEDKTGKSIVFITETGVFRNPELKHESDGADAEIYAYCFTLNNEPVLNWKVYDFVSDCQVDIVAEFIDNTLSITDLDKNGIAEIWLMYKTICHGDISPAALKIIMYEGEKKFAMRGESKIQIGADVNGKPEFIGGDYTLDKNFENAPEKFKNYALSLWNKNASK